MSSNGISPVSHAPVITLLFAALLGLAVSPVMAQTHTARRTSAPVRMVAAHILVNSNGRTLYVFAPDSRGKSTCSGQCAKFWPPRHLPKNAAPPSKIAGIPGTFGAITRTDGTRQLTYDGAPLYTFVGDHKPGDMNGQGLVASGGYWWVVVAGGR